MTDRLLSLSALLLHILVVAGAPVVEGVFDRVSPGARPHIEAQSDAPCVPVHSDLDCQVCRVLGRDQIASARVVASLGCPFTAFLSAPPAPVWHRSAIVAPRVGARAPPLV